MNNNKVKITESETIEFKKSTSELKEAVIAISAILNKHRQGELYFGIKNDGTVCGQDITVKTLRDISQLISDNIEPKIYPEISNIELCGKPCVRVHFKGNDTPYFAFGRVYMRVSDENRQLSAKELEHLILEKNRDKLQWDTEICKDAKLTDISSSKVKIFLKSCGLKYTSIEDALKKLNLLSNHRKLFNAAVILFGRKPQKFFPNAKLRCAVFATTNTVYPVDMQDFEGDLFSLIKQAEEYILKNIHIGMRLEGMYRVDVPEIDKKAFREAIINAFCHRDYHKFDSVNIAIFKDRLEIRNPGLLYGGLTIERIRKESVSERRNELIADIFHRIHFIEKWGRGIHLILELEPMTDFKEIGSQFISIFQRKNYVVDRKEGSLIEAGSQKSSQKSSQKIFALIQQNNNITIRELSKILKISGRAVINNINTLKATGNLKRIGPDKGGHWEILKK
ncbi:MAG: ATP-dependent DNA helicase [Elusimicrobia bacterium RIFOXYA2_FULL_39_19]|nr:MAG: ATP-dependent DNA helicase [Elusimicrobia bacterium RIFOXYA2_FULL_39_19]